jgi:hypothetical protein
MEPNCELRNSSTVAPQSLLLMNSAFIVEQAEKLAQRVMKQAGNSDAQAQAKAAWRFVFGAEASDAEAQDLTRYLTAQAKALAGGRTVKPEEAPLRALASLCQALLGSNQFLYVE